MEDKNFVSYEYKIVSVRAEKRARVSDLYEAFGWEITSAGQSVAGSVTLSMRRDRKLKHKPELVKIERQAEETYNGLQKLETAKTLGAQIFAYIFGVIAVLILGGGMSMTMVVENNVPVFAAGIILGVLGIALCTANYFIYVKLATDKTKKLLPAIDESEESLANLLEKGNGLLETDLL